MNWKKFLLPFFLFPLLIESTLAHCPLCTVGAAVAAGGAAWLGISKGIIGIFIGAFAVSIGWWIAMLIKKQYVPYQKWAIIGLSFLTTVLPLLPMMESRYPIFLYLVGGYGSLLNRTYILNLFLVGSILGGFIVSLTPWLSMHITKWRNGKTVPFQGILLTFILLAVTSTIMEVVI